jgi:antitoxin YefM
LTKIRRCAIIIVQDIEQFIVQNIVRSDVMLAVNYSTIRNNLKTYCDAANDKNETVIVTRKNEKNIVIMSLDKYNQMQKAMRNAEYLAKLDQAIAQLESGKGQVHEIIEVDDDE